MTLWKPENRSVRTKAAGLALFAALAMAAVGLFLSDARQSHADESRRPPAIRQNAVLPAALPAGAEAPPANTLLDITPAEALRINAAMPFAAGANPPARAFLISGASPGDEARAVECLTKAIYYEAGFESRQGKEAVAQVVLNRLRHPAFPKTVCGVVFQGYQQTTGCQFSFTCDGSLARTPAPAAWQECERVAVRALQGYVMADIGNATHYHTQWVVPYWASTLAKVRQIGAHIFYRWSGGWGQPSAFGLQYAGGEFMPGTAATNAMLTQISLERANALKEQDSHVDFVLAVASIDAAKAAGSAVPAAEAATTAPTEPVLEAPVAPALKPVGATIAAPPPRQGPPRLATPNGW